MNELLSIDVGTLDTLDFKETAMGSDITKNYYVKRTNHTEVKAYIQLCKSQLTPKVNGVKVKWEKHGGFSYFLNLEKLDIQESLTNKTLISNDDFTKILDAMDVLHSLKVIHGDLKPNHIFIGTNGVKFIDFDLSILDVDKRRNTKLPLKYMGNIPNEHYTTIYQGTPRYSSISQHLALKPNVCWDYESLCYIARYINEGSLPWSGVNLSDTQMGLNAVLGRKIQELYKGVKTSSPFMNTIFKITTGYHLDEAKLREYSLAAFNSLTLKSIAPELLQTKTWSSTAKDACVKKVHKEKEPDFSVTISNSDKDHNWSTIPEKVIKASDGKDPGKCLENVLSILMQEAQLKHIKGEKFKTGLPDMEEKTCIDAFRPDRNGEVDFIAEDCTIKAIKQLECVRDFHILNLNGTLDYQDTFTHPVLIGEARWSTSLRGVRKMDVITTHLVQKYQQLEMSLIYYQSKQQHSIWIHPLELLTTEVWGAVISFITTDKLDGDESEWKRMDNKEKTKLEERLSGLLLALPRVAVLASLGRMAFVQLGHHYLNYLATRKGKVAEERMDKSVTEEQLGSINTRLANLETVISAAVQALSVQGASVGGGVARAGRSSLDAAGVERGACSECGGEDGCDKYVSEDGGKCIICEHAAVKHRKIKK
eukprot:TRINITY_DN1647_c0_g1_i6.p1 TRINITY_DN1647_c0_g1~~TRINITY_DN1647_c0_g1_i6.p1  ORF type:complete len:685 (-),score=56.22 TRINITY_DN1647_c0_g1_i6:30-1979(-)